MSDMMKQKLGGTVYSITVRVRDGKNYDEPDLGWLVELSTDSGHVRAGAFATEDEAFQYGRKLAIAGAWRLDAERLSQSGRQP